MDVKEAIEMATARYYNEDKNDGGARHIYGVPQRDLTDEEYDAMPKWLQEQVDGSPMYRKTAPKTTTAPKATERVEKPVEASSTTDATEDTQDTE